MLCDVFPDAVLNTLTEEYSDFARRGIDDGQELRMKLGEVLVRVTRTLGNFVFLYYNKWYIPHLSNLS